MSSYRADTAPSADEASLRDDDALSCLEELTSGLLRRVAGGRRRLEKQVMFSLVVGLCSVASPVDFVLLDLHTTKFLIF